MSRQSVGMLKLPARNLEQKNAAEIVAEAMRNGTSREVHRLRDEVNDLKRRLCELAEDYYHDILEIRKQLKGVTEDMLKVQ